MSYEPPLFFYHLTRPENVESILENGLRCNQEGHIFTFTDWIMAEEIARNQILASEYAIFWIKASGISGELHEDNVTELLSPLSCIIKQERIEPEHLRYWGNVTLSQMACVHHRLKYSLMGMDGYQIDSLLAEVEEMQAS